MSGWLDEWIGGLVDGWMSGWMSGLLEAGLGGRAMRGTPAFAAGRGGEAAGVRDGGFVHHNGKSSRSRKRG